MFCVADMMTPRPHTLGEHDTLARALEVMQQLDIRHLPIVDRDNQLLGLVTQRDVLSAQHSSLEHSLDQNRLNTQALEAVNDRQLLTVSPRAGLKEAAKYMQKHKIGCLPVIQHKKLVGIITDSDFVAIAINLLELQEEVEPLTLEDDY
ncbi:Hypoxic response protein 1 [Vibrio stylophorae]|uniref:Hypoxic response protein 1 n=1 Tax=Vibrio stylophorae TaxID=659351 RepID=A0ABM8ZRD8_9VIBR|nr:CBS domain-containing protein [Vibrio stylophorae]CAH0532841.1 Hypoxic response protein 1 [Vibrio stylophorae]